MLLRFFKSENGNYSLIFAIALVPIMSSVAGVADYVGTTNGAAKLQQSLDATALAIATKYHSGMSDAEVDKFGSDFFSANINSVGLSFNPDSQSDLSGVKDTSSALTPVPRRAGRTSTSPRPPSCCTRASSRGRTIGKQCVVPT